MPTWKYTIKVSAIVARWAYPKLCIISHSAESLVKSLSEAILLRYTTTLCYTCLSFNFQSRVTATDLGCKFRTITQTTGYKDMTSFPYLSLSTCVIVHEGLGGHVTIHAEFHLETIRKWSVAGHEHHKAFTGSAYTGRNHSIYLYNIVLFFGIPTQQPAKQLRNCASGLQWQSSILGIVTDSHSVRYIQNI